MFCLKWLPCLLIFSCIGLIVYLVRRQGKSPRSRPEVSPAPTHNDEEELLKMILAMASSSIIFMFPLTVYMCTVTWHFDRCCVFYTETFMYDLACLFLFLEHLLCVIVLVISCTPFRRELKILLQLEEETTQQAHSSTTLTHY